MEKQKDIKAAIKDFEKTAADLEKLNELMIKNNAEMMKKWKGVQKW